MNFSYKVGCQWSCNITEHTATVACAFLYICHALWWSGTLLVLLFTCSLHSNAAKPLTRGVWTLWCACHRWSMCSNQLL